MCGFNDFFNSYFFLAHWYFIVNIYVFHNFPCYYESFSLLQSLAFYFSWPFWSLLPTPSSLFLFLSLSLILGRILARNFLTFSIVPYSVIWFFVSVYLISHSNAQKFILRQKAVNAFFLDPINFIVKSYLQRIWIWFFIIIFIQNIFFIKTYNFMIFSYLSPWLFPSFPSQWALIFAMTSVSPPSPPAAQ